MNIRKIKNIGPPLYNDEMGIHPNTLFLTKNVGILSCPTKYYYEDNILKMTKNSSCKDISKYHEQKFFLTPSLILSSTELLNIYNIHAVDDLNNFIKININKKTNFKTINRILNSWIKNNLDDLKNHNDFLENIYLNLFNEYYISLSDNKNIKKILKFIKSWILKKTDDDFNFNLGEDLINFLST
jgi:hypothetical protein